MNVLVIEDDQLALKSLKHIVENLGHTVDGAENAEEAIIKIEGGKFDLVFSDIMMPGMSGLSLIAILRTVQLCKIPIIAMSTLSNAPLIDAAYDVGANGFIAKPFAIEDIAEKLKKFNKDLNGGDKEKGQW